MLLEVMTPSAQGAGMMRARFLDEQIFRILQDTDRSSIAEAVKHHRVSELSIYGWRKKFGDLEIEVMKGGRRKRVVSVQDRLEQSRLKSSI